MDSGNSNSMQSSSGGGDEEYDSRADSISSFLNNNSSSYNPPPAPTPAQQQQHHHHLHHPSLFDHLSSNYSFDPLSASSSSRLSSSLPLNTNHHPNSLLNLDMVWSKSLRSEPNCTDLGGLFVPSSSSSASAFPALHVSPRGTESVSSKASSFLATASGPGLNIDQADINLNNNNNSNHHSTMMVRNPKKRSRASRRAPTTVLTTDTTNFRAMVQEFTGIPAPPFTSSHFPRTRLDLFGTSSSTSSGLMMRSTIGSHLDSSPPQPPPSSYNLLRPFAQKLFNPIPFSTSNNSSMFIDAIASASTSTNATATTTTTNINYQQLPSPHQNLFGINMQNNNPILNLHSLLQVPPKYPLANSPILETKPPPAQGTSLEELGLSHAAAAASASHLNTNLMSGLQSLVSSSDNNNNPTSWHGHGAGTGATAAVGSNENEEATAGLFANGKLNSFSQASSEFHRDKGQESVNVAATTTRTEGMVESWICSSD